MSERPEFVIKGIDEDGIKVLDDAISESNQKRLDSKNKEKKAKEAEAARLKEKEQDGK